MPATRKKPTKKQVVHMSATDPLSLQTLEDAVAEAERAADAAGLCFASVSYRFNSENGALIVESLNLNFHARVRTDELLRAIREMQRD